MSLALYRRYRPETFAEVIGQTQVTVPLTAAFRSGRVNHAYLFSGPRGCGKTTSARILARTLNCVENTPDHPIDTPCGKCDSCIELSRDGNGSLDVVEIDAASHGGVDAARDLRERATFTPTRDRYKIFIIDEAHMVTKEGFNALLKVVEEPPPHIKFVFATTEPDKVLGTIRSRTHHYPFRLVPPSVLGPYLQDVCAQEGVTLGESVLPLVLRAGGGSVRDSLSVLDQLIAGSPTSEVDYQTAVGLLGYTSAAILDDAVAAVADQDGAAVFGVVAKVIDAGITPHRFVEDLLERFRDLIVVSVAGDQAGVAMGDRPHVEVEALQAQGAGFNVADLTRFGESISASLNQMVGAVSPRLQLELLMARLVVPTGVGTSELAARIAKLERGLGVKTNSGAVTSDGGTVSNYGGAVTSDDGATRGSARAPRDSDGASQSRRLAQRPAAGASRLTHAAETQQSDAPRTRTAPKVESKAAQQEPAELPDYNATTSAIESPLGSAQQDAKRSESPVAAPVRNESSELTQLKADWSALVAAVSSPVTRSMLTHTVGPTGFSGADKVVIGVRQPAIAQRLAEPRQQSAVNRLLSSALGHPVTALFVPAGDNEEPLNTQPKFAHSPQFPKPEVADPDDDWLAGIPLTPTAQVGQLNGGDNSAAAGAAVQPNLTSGTPANPTGQQQSNRERQATPSVGAKPGRNSRSQPESETDLPEDEASPDDPDADGGLRGVEAALKILDGVVIEETYLD